MTEAGTVITERRFIGGPLDGQDADTAKPIYRHADGSPARIPYGDARLMRGRWEADDTGIYSRNGRGYRWITRPGSDA